MSSTSTPPTSSAGRSTTRPSDGQLSTHVGSDGKCQLFLAKQVLYVAFNTSGFQCYRGRACSVPCISNDRIYCKILAHNAVHSAFAGYTGVTVGLVNTHYVLLPIPVVISAPRRVSALCHHLWWAPSSTLHLAVPCLSQNWCQPMYAPTSVRFPWSTCLTRSLALMVQVDPRGKMWNRLRASIGQPNFE